MSASTRPYGVDVNNRQEIFHAEKSQEDKGNRVRVTASFEKAKKDFEKMKISVETWQVAEAEQLVRKGLGSVIKWFCPRINTISPLVAASLSIHEMKLSRVDLKEKMLKCDSNNKAIPKTFYESSKERFQIARYEVAQAIDGKLKPDTQATWQGWSIQQWWNNKDEAVVSTSVKAALVEEGQRWSSPKFKVKPESGGFPNIERVKKENVHNQAKWNVYNKVLVNMTITAGVVCLPIVFTCLAHQNNGSRR